MSTKRLKNIGFVAILLITGFIYYVTLAPSLYWIDAGIYLSTIKEFGIAYSPGYPIYIILAKLWSFLPLPGMDFTQKINFLSSIFASLSCGILYLTILELFANGFTFFKKTEQEKNIFSPIVGVLIAVLISLIFGVSYNLWFQATYAEVYTFHIFLFALIVYFVILLAKEGLPDKFLTNKQKKLWILIAITYGISYANHPMTIGIIPAIIWIGWQFKYPFKKNKKFFKTLIIIFFLSGLLPYIYMPIRSLQNPKMDWGNVENVKNFISHVAASVMVSGVSEFGSNKNFLTTLFNFFQLVYYQFFAFALLLAGFGIYFVKKNSKELFRFLLIISGSAILLGIILTSGEYESWLIPGYYIIALFLSAGITYIVSRWHFTIKIIIVLLIITIFLSIRNNWYTMDRSENFFPTEVGHNILKTIEDDAILLSEGGPFSSSLVYNQRVLGEKPDVIIIQTASLWMPWARENLKKYEEENGVFVPDMDIKAEDSGAEKSQQFYQFNNDYMEAFVVGNIDKFDIYTDRVSNFLTSESSQKYGVALVPWGFVYKYIRIKEEDRELYKFSENNTFYSPKLWDFDFNLSQFCKFKLPNWEDFTFFECQYFGMELQNGYGYQHPKDINIQANKDFDVFRSGYSASYLGLGNIYVKSKEYKKAIFYYNRAINLLTENFTSEQKYELYFKKALALFYDEQYEKAIDYTYKIDKIYPKRSETAWILGASFQKLGKKQEAFGILTEALKLFPKDDDLNNVLNTVLMDYSKTEAE